MQITLVDLSCLVLFCSVEMLIFVFLITGSFSGQS